ncbi:hypothetical protein FRC09_017269 [Ceratobasidium sp. 395]|nr:hypothetical protein FRC09_017269 [Ceratobasidium sp. 395]
MESLWGLPLSQYLNKPLSKRNKSFHVTYEEAQRSIEQLLSFEHVTVSTLENLILLSRFPRYLQGLNCPGTIPKCIKILKTYCSEHQLFERAYGYLCLRALCLVLDVAVLTHFNAFETHPVFLEFDSDVDILSDTAATLLARALEPGPNDPLMTGLLKYYTLPGDTQLVCLPSAGGISVSDTKFIIDELRDDAKTFSVIIRRAAIPGLATLLSVTMSHFWSLTNASEFVVSHYMLCSTLMSE